jgi:hypothetical protein
MSGFSELGAALGGLDQSGTNAYQTGMLRGAQGADLLEQARQRRNKNLAMAAITPDKIQAALSNPQGQEASDLAAALVQAGENPEQLANYGKTMQGTGERGQLWTAATQPGATVTSLNPMLAALAGKPVAVTDVEGNTLINKYVDPNQEAAVGGNVPTAVGQSDITAALARAGASNASAARQYAGIGADKAANYELVDDGSGNLVSVNKMTQQAMPVMSTDGVAFKGSKSGGKTVTPTSPTTNDLAIVGALNRQGVVDPAKAQQFVLWQAQQVEKDPRMANSAYAAQKYVAHLGGMASSVPASIGQALSSAFPGVLGPSIPDSGTTSASAPAPYATPVPASMAEALNSAATTKPIPGKVNASGDYTPPTKTVVRTGKQNGRKVVQYSDGTIDYAD